ncbi:MAG: hypothetical protein K2M89_02870 [Clostridiales bacterium]|nr:hypothetical protein [Clostridiales bacterium]
MDKIETALTATEDNAAAIRALSNRLREQTEKTGTEISDLQAKTSQNKSSISYLTANLMPCVKATIIHGKKSSKGLTFGTVESIGNMCAIVTFDDAEQRKVVFNNKVLTTSFSPALVNLPRAKAELLVAGGSIGSAVILGLVTSETTL